MQRKPQSSLFSRKCRAVKQRAENASGRRPRPSPRSPAHRASRASVRPGWLAHLQRHDGAHGAEAGQPCQRAAVVSVAMGAATKGGRAAAAQRPARRLDRPIVLLALPPQRLRLGAGFDQRAGRQDDDLPASRNMAASASQSSVRSSWRRLQTVSPRRRCRPGCPPPWRRNQGCAGAASSTAAAQRDVIGHDERAVKPISRAGRTRPASRARLGMADQRGCHSGRAEKRAGSACAASSARAAWRPPARRTPGCAGALRS